MPRGPTSRTSRPPPPGTPRAAALRLLGRRDYTAAELEARLVARGHAASDVRQALARLAAEGLQDDRRTAGAHIRTAALVKGRGPHRIRRELEARGVAPQVILELLAASAEADERASLERVLAGKRLTATLPMVERRRLFRQLLRRGFSADAIAAALRDRLRPD